MKMWMFFLAFIISFNVMAMERGDKSFTQFLNLFVHPDDHHNFTAHYTKFLHHCERLAHDLHSAKRVRGQRLALECRQQGSAALYLKGNSEARKLLATLTNSPKEKNRFLLRCGAYDRFAQERAMQKGTMWYKMCSYAQAAQRSMVQWCTSLLKQTRLIA